MVASLIRAALSQRLVVVVLALVLCAFGVREATRLSVDAFPDVTNVQVQVATEAPGRSPEEIERFLDLAERLPSLTAEEVRQLSIVAPKQLLESAPAPKGLF